MKGWITFDKKVEPKAYSEKIQSFLDRTRVILPTLKKYPITPEELAKLPCFPTLIEYPKLINGSIYKFDETTIIRSEGYDAPPIWIVYKIVYQTGGKYFDILRYRPHFTAQTFIHHNRPQNGSGMSA